MNIRGRAAVFGADGQIGREAVRALGAIGLETTRFGRAQCDVTDAKAVDAALFGFGEGDIVLNAAAYNDVVRAEDEFAPALLANGCAPYFIALAAARCRATLVHFGTDYVFDGRKASPYVESDPVRPLNAYGRSKLCGEILASSASPRHFIVRISAVFGIPAGGRPNFVERVLASTRNGAALRLMGEGTISPTYAADAADIVAGLIQAGAEFGTYHASNRGACSWFEFAEEIAKLAGRSPNLEKLAAHETDARLNRPLFSALESEKLDALGLQPKPWQDGLRRYLVATGQLKRG